MLVKVQFKAKLEKLQQLIITKFLPLRKNMEVDSQFQDDKIMSKLMLLRAVEAFTQEEQLNLQMWDIKLQVIQAELPILLLMDTLPKVLTPLEVNKE